MFNLSDLLCESGARSLEFRPEVGSTNDWAIELAADDERELPLLVVTQRQTGGRGRGSNRWWSADGALTFSLVVDASRLDQARWPQVALASGLAICESLAELGERFALGLKWPNDVYLGERKLCGILVEAPAHTRGRIVIGVGVNLNNSFTSAPDELKAKATALCDEAGGEFDSTETLSRLVKGILTRIERLATEQHSLVEGFRRYCFLTDKFVRIQSGRDLVVGRCSGIDEDGALLVRTDAKLVRLQSGTVIDWDR